MDSKRQRTEKTGPMNRGINWPAVQTDFGVQGSMLLRKGWQMWPSQLTQPKGLCSLDSTEGCTKWEVPHLSLCP